MASPAADPPPSPEPPDPGLDADPPPITLFTVEAVTSLPSISLSLASRVHKSLVDADLILVSTIISIAGRECYSATANHLHRHHHHQTSEAISDLNPPWRWSGNPTATSYSPPTTRVSRKLKALDSLFIILVALNKIGFSPEPLNLASSLDPVNETLAPVKENPALVERAMCCSVKGPHLHHRISRSMLDLIPPYSPHWRWSRSSTFIPTASLGFLLRPLRSILVSLPPTSFVLMGLDIVCLEG